MGADDHEEVVERPEPEEIAAPSWAPVIHAVGSLAGVAVLVGGAAFLTGWAYTDAFYERLGIPSGALNLGPADYAAAKVEIWFYLALAAVLAVPAVAMTAQMTSVGEYGLLGVWRKWFVWWSLWWWAIAYVAGLLGLWIGTLALALTGEARFLVLFAIGAYFATMGALWGARSSRRVIRHFLLWTAAALALGAFTWLLIGVDRMGKRDAEALLAGQDCDARLVAAAPLGLPGEYYESGGYVTESVGVIRATGETYFLVVRGTEMVYSLPTARVLRMEYTPDKGR